MFTGFLTEHKSVMRPQSAIKPILQRRQVIGSFKDFSKRKEEIESPEHVVSQSIEGDKNINLHKTVADGIATAITRRRVTQEKNDAQIEEYVEPLEKADVDDLIKNVQCNEKQLIFFSHN